MESQDDNTTLGVLKHFMGVQRARAEGYSRLHSGYQSMLQTQQEGTYMRLLHQSTQLFLGLSQQAVEAEHRLATEFQRPELAAVIRTIQNLERDKLRLTLSLQALKRAHRFEDFTWQKIDTAEAPLDGTVSGPDISAINFSHPHSGACGCLSAQASPSPEATEPEWEQACVEATKGLQTSIDGINDAMEELRYYMADLAGLDS